MSDDVVPECVPESVPESKQPIMIPVDDIVALWPCKHELPSKESPLAQNPDRVDGLVGHAVGTLRNITNSMMTKECIERGQSSEVAFLREMERLGWTPLSTSFVDNYQRHVDFKLAKDGQLLRCDVKGLRSLRRNGRKQNALLFVEMHETGWLRTTQEGGPDIIAQQISEDPIAKFVLLDRVKLRDFALGQVDMSSPLVHWPEQCYKRLYRRKDKRTELLSLIDLEQAIQYSGCGYV